MNQKLLTVLAIVVFVFTFSTMAGAVVLTFDDVPGGSYQDGDGLIHPPGGSYHGFKLLNDIFDYPLVWIDSVRDYWPPDYGSAISDDFTMYNMHGGNAIITSSSGQDFIFEGLYARVWGYEDEGRPVNIEGYNEGNPVATWSIDGLFLNRDFEYFAGVSTPIDELRLNFTGDLGNPEYDEFLGTYLVDNLALNEGDPPPIPEPATMLLLGTGLVGLVGTKIRKKKK